MIAETGGAYDEVQWELKGQKRRTARMASELLFANEKVSPCQVKVIVMSRPTRIRMWQLQSHTLIIVTQATDERPHMILFNPCTLTVPCQLSIPQHQETHRMLVLQFLLNILLMVLLVTLLPPSVVHPITVLPPTVRLEMDRVVRIDVDERQSLVNGENVTGIDDGSGCRLGRSERVNGANVRSAREGGNEGERSEA